MNQEQQPHQGREPDQAAEPLPDQPESADEPVDNTGNDGSPEDEATAEMLEEAAPRIWVGSLSDYNNGVLHGRWIGAAREEDEIWADIGTMLTKSPTAAMTGEPAEEWGIFDHENFGAYKPDQHENIGYVSAVARGIAEHGPAFAAWADVVEDEARFGDFQDAYLGEYDTVAAYVEQLLEDCGFNELLDERLPESIRRYVDINVPGLAQDLWLSGDIHVCHKDEGGVWIFDGRL